MARRFSYPVSMKRISNENVYRLQQKDKRGNVIDKKIVTLKSKRYKINGMKKRSSGGAGG